MKSNETVLVTGGTGFVGMRIVLQLLQKGYKVRTTVHSLKRKDKLIDALKAQGFTQFDQLSFAEAELTKDDNWGDAMKGCKYVLSVASPVFFEIPKEENAAIRPAVDGILRILRFAVQAGVQRVVMTSNFGAVGFSQTDQNRETTEADWTDIHLKGLSVYEKSKTLAERAAWDFIKKEGGHLEFTTINPVAIFGPSLDGHFSGSLDIIKNMLYGTWKAIPPISLNLIDVRDVADLHIRAMENPAAKGQRFIASADGQISMPEIAAFLKSKRPEISSRVATRSIPVFMLNLLSLFNKQAREGAAMVKINRNVSNAKAKRTLGWKPIVPSLEQIILDSADSMVRFGVADKKQ